MLEQLEGRVVPTGLTHVWIGGDVSRVDGDARAHPNDPNAPVEWSNANNWLDGNVPGPNDTAVFTANTGSYTFPDVDPGPPPSVDLPITYNGPFNDSPLVDGNFSIASLQVNSSAGFSMTVAAGESLTLTGASEWDTGTITVQNTGAFINANSGTLTVGGSLVAVTGTLTNQGTVIQQASGTIQLANATLDNQANAFWKLNSDVGFTFDNNLPGVFNNSGTVDKVGGTGTSNLFSDGGFNNLGGTIEVDTGKLIPWDGGGGVSTGGTFIVGPNAELLYTDNNTSNTFTGTYNNGPSSANFVLFQGGINIGSSGATFNFAPGFFQFQGGDIDASGTTFTNSGSITVNDLNNSEFFSGTFQNSGTLTLTGTGDLFILGGGTLVNPTSGLIDIQSDAGISSSNSSGGLNNQGTVQKSGGSNTSDIVLSLGFNNQGGTLSANSGTLVPWDGGGTNTGGLFTANGGTLQFFDTGASATFTGTYTNGPSTGHLVHNRGTIDPVSSGATFNFAPGFFQWQGGNIDTSKGTLTNSGSTTVDTAGSPELFFGTLQNSGTLTLVGTGDLFILGAATLANATGGLIDIQNDAGISSSNSSGGLNNQGTLQKSGGNGTSVIVLSQQLNNTGTVSVSSGFLDSQTTAQVNNNTLTGGTWNVLANARLRVNGFANLTINNGNITPSGPGSVFTNITNLATNNGSFSLLGGQGFTTVGDLANNGSVTLGPGDTLTTTGNYTEGRRPTSTSSWVARPPASLACSSLTPSTSTATAISTLAW
jgi:hypothetical protein